MFSCSRMFESLKFYCRKNLLVFFVQVGKMSLISKLILPPGTEVNTVKPVLGSHLRGGRILAPFRSDDPLVQIYLYYKPRKCDCFRQVAL